MKLHLGCGQTYLDGYVNIDYPATEHTVQTATRTDLCCDLTTLSYPSGSIEEIRLHHVFEHFPRPVALALLCRWRDWLAGGGRLRIETPDLMASARLLTWPWVGYAKKQEVVRHLFGSHEAPWAVHWDGWYAERFRRTLEALGFYELSIRTSGWRRLRNVEVVARKGPEAFDADAYRKAVTQLLSLSTVKSRRFYRDSTPVTGSEADMLAVWLNLWEQAYRTPAPAVAAAGPR